MIFEDPSDANVYTCTLMVTHACNLRCSYCYEDHKADKYMSFAVAKNAILDSVERVRAGRDGARLEIDFMGGEPFMNFDLIKEVVEWLKREPLEVPFLCFATTNGTLLDDDKKEWLRRNRDLIWLGVSVDGTEAMQIANRHVGLSSKSIDLEFFKTTWPEQDFHMTISRETLPYLADGVKSLQVAGYKLNAALAQGENWSVSDAEELGRQLEMLAAWYLHEGAQHIPLNLLTRITHLAKTGDAQPKYCGSGGHMRAYDVDGKIYACHMFTPLVQGDCAMEFAAMQSECYLGKDPHCADCILRSMCPTCVGFNLLQNGNPNKRDYRMCRMILANGQVSSAFQIKRLLMEDSISNAHDYLHGVRAIETYEKISSYSIRDAHFPLK